MKLKFIVAVIAIAAMPVYAQAQNKPPKVSKADVQKVVAMITADKAKTKTYCDITKLGEQIDAADQAKDTKKVDALSKQMDEMSQKLGPEYAMRRWTGCRTSTRTPRTARTSPPYSTVSTSSAENKAGVIRQ